MNPSPSDPPPSDGERAMASMAVAAGLIDEGEPMSPELQNYSYLLLHACAQIGSRYGDADANAGDHIRAVFYP
ncbi:hypothetical protein [Acidovorax sp. PRC11]|uniref:hypothetical protein n=1 Tax=Acidovorax sp. PRC11 TaxID=2962592 RepID=UPI0028810883|nr:hypothetical protein [Acidovorax sp. PRC11]MDT0137742.1 hypothetical protein [Acidovorax sp. PRC11]